MLRNGTLFLSLCLLLFSGACGPAAAPDAPSPVTAAPVVQPTSTTAPTGVPAESPAPAPTEVPMSFVLTSTAFNEGEPVPVQYTCDGEDISPPLAWDGAPGGTQSFALIMDDPDAPVGTWDHWILFNIPADTRSLQENLPITGKNQEPGSIFVGSNSWRRADYGGPCPPSGTHRYFFKLYALDTTISLLPGADKGQVLAAIEGHILAETQLMGTYSR